MQVGWFLIRKIEDKYVALRRKQGLNASFDWSMMHKRKHKKMFKMNIATIKSITMKTLQNKTMQVRTVFSVNI